MDRTSTRPEIIVVNSSDTMTHLLALGLGMFMGWMLGTSSRSRGSSSGASSVELSDTARGNTIFAMAPSRSSAQTGRLKTLSQIQQIVLDSAEVAAAAAAGNGDTKQAEKINTQAQLISGIITSQAIASAGQAIAELSKISDDLTSAADELTNATTGLKNLNSFLGVWTKLLDFVGLGKK